VRRRSAPACSVAGRAPRRRCGSFPHGWNMGVRLLAQLRASRRAGHRIGRGLVLAHLGADDGALGGTRRAERRAGGERRARNSSQRGSLGFRPRSISVRRSLNVHGAFCVALVGPDGVGKTTISRALAAEGSGRFRYVYMGDNPAASNISLPTTRWWKSRYPSERHTNGDGHVNGSSGSNGQARRPSLWARIRSPRRKAGGFVTGLREESYRLGVAQNYVHQGHIVLFDRHFAIDYFHSDLAANRPRSFKRRAHGFFLR